VELTGRSAIVTGGAGGLGAATVRRLVEQGVGTVVFDVNQGAAEALADGRRQR
jgi:NAD(P)-dependent dehydrogenase (short-subunit alcohol dehydrogenase family)